MISPRFRNQQKSIHIDKGRQQSQGSTFAEYWKTFSDEQNTDNNGKPRVLIKLHVNEHPNTKLQVDTYILQTHLDNFKISV